MCGVSETTIRKWQGANQIKVKTAEILTEGGLQGADLISENLIQDWIIGLDTNRPGMLGC